MYESLPAKRDQDLIQSHTFSYEAKSRVQSAVASNLSRVSSKI